MVARFWILAVLLQSAVAVAAGYDDMRAAAVARCQKIDPAEYQTGLFFNPDGYRSYYVRSECFQRTAVEFRDPALCAEVKRRYALFSSSWGYSSAHCRELVADGIAADRTRLEETKHRYNEAPLRLSEFRVERNGNGRDFDIIPSFTGAYGHGYVLRFEIVQPANGGAGVLLYSAGYYVDANSRLRIFLRQDDVRKRFPQFALDRLYPVRATIILNVGTGGPSGWWSDAFIEKVFPLQERSHSIERQVRF